MKKIYINLLLIGILFLPSCKDFLEIDAPKNSIVQSAVFKNNDVATSAILGIYASLANSDFASGDYNSVSSLCGLSSDELNSHSTLTEEFYNNQISVANVSNNTLWSSIYKNIYSTNAILEGLAEKNGVTQITKNQIKGEALFLRAFNYFYLVNLYGAVPLHLTTNYQVTTIAKKVTQLEIYQQIIGDLKESEALLPEAYITVERVRANKSAVQALLARTYLYMEDWINAEKYATLVIDKVEIYNLTTLDEVFLKNSKEALWQLIPTANANAQEGNLFILETTPNFVSLRTDFALNGFEADDHRNTSWVKSFTNTTGTYYYPFKYKVRSSTVTEYSMMLRLAEQYLIRAEARANLNNLDGAVGDTNKIRDRADLPDLDSDLTKQQVLNTILKERSIEFFAEWGHRWFDLKRTGKAESVLSLVKSNWQPTAVLYPIPLNEINRNKNLKQNKGY